MTRIPQAGVFCILVPALLLAGDSEPGIIASAHESGLQAGIGPVQLPDVGGLVIRSVQELVAVSARPDAAKEVEAELAKALEVERLDWNKQMVLAVRGPAGTRLDRIQIESLTAAGNVLTVAWKVKQRPPHAGPGIPVSLFLVERFDEVKFVEAGQ